MSIYIDISDFYKARGRSGIQRVVREVAARMIKDKKIDHPVKVITYDTHDQVYKILPAEHIKMLFADKLDKSIWCDDYESIEISQLGEGDIFFDVDNGWNTPLKRPALYPKLNSQSVKIYSMLHDLIPIIKSQFADPNASRNYVGYISAVLAYSDLVFCNSRSTEKDLQDLASRTGLSRKIHTSVTGLGSDFGAVNFKNSANDRLQKAGLKGRYIVMVGTVEPRKRQDKLLSAFEMLAKKHEDISLVIVGKAGWGIGKLANRIETHDLIDERIFWLKDVSDQDLDSIYRNASFIAYLSSAEGYGLPISEGLSYGKITVAFDNTSQREAGGSYADYARHETPNEVFEIIDMYLDNPRLYKEKTKKIEKECRAVTWDETYDRFHDVFYGMGNVNKVLARKQPKKLQVLFISNRLEDIADTIKSDDLYLNFVKEYIIITPPDMVDEMNSIKSKHKILVIDEQKMLGKNYQDFKDSDHATKNWMLRSSIVNLKEVDDEFVMSDDDNRPLEVVDKSFFINKDGSYNAYYFYELPRWLHANTDYDVAQHNMNAYFARLNLERLVYSSHQPQIINKQIFAEMIEYMAKNKVYGPIDEWSTYFNYGASKYPRLFNKRIFEVLGWPVHPSSWDFQFYPAKYTFENYYSETYKSSELFEDLDKLSDSGEKIKRVAEREEVYKKSWAQLNSAIDISSRNDMAHGSIGYESSKYEVYIGGIPYLLSAHSGTILRFKVSFKILPKRKNVKLPKHFRIEARDAYGRLVAGSGYPIIQSVGGLKSPNLYEADMSVTLAVKRPRTRYLSYHVFVDHRLINPKVGVAKSLLIGLRPGRKLKKSISP